MFQCTNTCKINEECQCSKRKRSCFFCSWPHFIGTLVSIFLSRDLHQCKYVQIISWRVGCVTSAINLNVEQGPFSLRYPQNTQFHPRKQLIPLTVDAGSIHSLAAIIYMVFYIPGLIGPNFGDFTKRRKRRQLAEIATYLLGCPRILKISW